MCYTDQNYRPEDNVCIYNVYQITKNWGPGLYNPLRHAGDRRYFSSLSLMRNQREAHMFYLAREVGKFGHVLAEKKATLMINEFKYGQTWKIWQFPLSLSLYSTFKCLLKFQFYKVKLKQVRGQSKNGTSKIEMLRDFVESHAGFELMDAICDLFWLFREHFLIFMDQLLLAQRRLLFL